MIPNVLLL